MYSGMHSRDFKKCFSCESPLRYRGTHTNYQHADGKNHLTCKDCIAKLESQVKPEATMSPDLANKLLNISDQMANYCSVRGWNCAQDIRTYRMIGGIGQEENWHVQHYTEICNRSIDAAVEEASV